MNRYLHNFSKEMCHFVVGFVSPGGRGLLPLRRGPDQSRAAFFVSVWLCLLWQPCTPTCSSQHQPYIHLLLPPPIIIPPLLKHHRTTEAKSHSRRHNTRTPRNSGSRRKKNPRKQKTYIKRGSVLRLPVVMINYSCVVKPLELEPEPHYTTTQLHNYTTAQRQCSPCCPRTDTPLDQY